MMKTIIFIGSKILKFITSCRHNRDALNEARKRIKEKKNFSIHFVRNKNSKTNYYIEVR